MLDRLRLRRFDPFAALAAAAAVTERLGLATMIAIGPLRNAALLVKQAASVDALSGGRLTLGLAVGARADDYEARRRRPPGPRRAPLRAARRPARLGRARRAGTVRRGPSCSSAASSGPAFARMARYADGYAHGGGPPRAFARAAASALRGVERPRPPRPAAAVGAGVLRARRRGTPARAYLRDYYAFTGPFAEQIAAGNLTSPRAIRDLVRGYEEAGCDELVLLPTVADPAQLDRLAEVLA